MKNISVYILIIVILLVLLVLNIVIFLDNTNNVQEFKLDIYNNEYIVKDTLHKDYVVCLFSLAEMDGNRTHLRCS